MKKLTVQISIILKVSKSIEVRYRYLSINIYDWYRNYVKKGIDSVKSYHSQDRKGLIPEFGIEDRYRKVSISEKGIDTQH